MLGSVDELRGVSRDGTATWSVAPLPWRVLLAVAVTVLLLGAGLREGLGGSFAMAPALRADGIARQGLLSLPLTAQGPVSAAVSADSSVYQVGGGASRLWAQSPAQHLRAGFESTGVTVSSGATRLRLSVRGVGYGLALSALGAATPHANRNRVLYTYPGLVEWYANGPLGLEQGFTLSRGPAGHANAPLTLSMALSGNARPSLANGGQDVELTRAGNVALRYGGLIATDASGRVLHSWMQLNGSRLLLRVQASGARYPLRIDPFVQQGAPLTGAGEAGAAQFGDSVSLSSDGNTALIGGSEDNEQVGAAWVFTRTGETWTQQGPKLTGGGEVGTAHFGDSVSLSGDGNTAVIGGLGDNHNNGAVWVFTRSGETWTQLGEKLTAGSAARFGSSVAIAHDGNTILAGGPDGGGLDGAAWVFTRSGESFTLQTKLIAAGELGEGRFGSSVALSNDGNTALIGGPEDNGGVGAAWVFTRSGETWSEQAKLTASGEANAARFGDSVALSADGNTALTGAPMETLNHVPGQGAAWVFTRSGETWTQQGGRLTASKRGKDFVGDSVALSEAGNTALVGAESSGESASPDAALVFTRLGGTWSQFNPILTSGNPKIQSNFGSSVALSASGETALVGADKGVGQAAAFARREPGTGPEFGRCVTTAANNGIYTTASCTTPTVGSFEWLPGVVKNTFASAIADGAATLETVHGSKVVCTSEVGSGEYTGRKTVGGVVLTLTGCQARGQQCSSSGAAAGEIVTSSLEGTLGVEKLGKKAIANKIALDLSSAGGAGSFVEFSCGGTEVSVRGSVIVPLAANEMASTTRLAFSATKGKQKPERFAGGGKDVLEASFAHGGFEQAGLTLALRQTSEEAVEVNAAF